MPDGRTGRRICLKNEIKVTANATKFATLQMEIKVAPNATKFAALQIKKTLCACVASFFSHVMF